MKRHIKRLTYRNLMIVIHKIMDKGYTMDEAEPIARRLFDEYEANPQGWCIEQMISMVLTKEEYEEEQRLAEQERLIFGF